jgi:hypothetical protein
VLASLTRFDARNSRLRNLKPRGNRHVRPAGRLDSFDLNRRKFCEVVRFPMSSPFFPENRSRVLEVCRSRDVFQILKSVVVLVSVAVIYFVPGRRIAEKGPSHKEMNNNRLPLIRWAPQTNVQVPMVVVGLRLQNSSLSVPTSHPAKATHFVDIFITDDAFPDFRHAGMLLQERRVCQSQLL